MIREATTVPGFDCIRGPCPSKGCPGRLGERHPRNHGIHGEEWIYVVAFDDRRAALVLTVYTDIFPATVPDWIRKERAQQPLSERRRGADVTLHASVKEGSSVCEYVASGHCDTGDQTSALIAHEIFRSHGDPGAASPQPEAFWRRMETLLDAWYTKHLAAAAEDERTRCPTCKGTGRRPSAS